MRGTPHKDTKTLRIRINFLRALASLCELFLVYFFGGALFLPPPDGLLVPLFVGQPAGFGPLLGGIGAGRPPPPLFPPLALLIFFSLIKKDSEI